MMIHLTKLAMLLVVSRANVIYSNIKNEIDGNLTTTDVHLEYVLLDENSNSCKRTCTHGASPMVCKFYFQVEWYHTLSKACYNCPFTLSDCFRKDCIPGDGTKRGVVAINRTIPGPTIQVCKGDRVIVDVSNELGSEATAMHWHGQHQKDTPYMDGVPYVTQCPILPHDTFRYTFTATQGGTHFWHSHIGMQRADGAFGPLLVNVPEDEEPNSQFYDYDLASHIMVIIDWDKQTGLDLFLSHHHNDGDNKPASILINGLGRFKQFNSENNNTIFTPTARFYVEQGYRYRFRIINAGFLNCPIEMSIDNHTLKIISTDGNDVAPVEASSLVTYAGERFDFIVDADQEKNLYWIRFRGLMDCDERFTKAYQMAVLEYQQLENNVPNNDYPDGEIPDWDNSHKEGIQVNSLNRGVESNRSLFVTMPHLESLLKWDYSMKTKPDFQYYIAYDFYKIDNNHFHKAPYYPFHNYAFIPLLSQRDELADDVFCNRETLTNKNCTSEQCECHHGIKIPLDAVVEFVFVDEGFAYDANHPLHLHGYAFRVVAMERVGRNVTVEEIRERDRLGLIKRNLLDAPLKDTVTVPDGGYTIVRFQASNPGFWILHCHLEFHSEIGMAMIIQVGETEDMKPVPANFPKCGDYLPDPFRDGVGKNNSDSKTSNYAISNHSGEITKIFTVLLIILNCYLAMNAVL